MGTDLGTSGSNTSEELDQIKHGENMYINELKEAVDRLQAAARYPDLSNRELEFVEILEHYERFQEFFIKEQQLLLKEGLPADLVLSLATESENILYGMKKKSLRKRRSGS